ACLAAVWAWLGGTRHGLVRGKGVVGLARLAVRNAGRNPVRSLLTAGLLASAAFLLVAVEAVRREPGGALLARDSGSGGIALPAESDLPVYRDLNSTAGRDEIEDRLRTRLEKEHGGNTPEVKAELAADSALLKDISIVPFRVHSGDDASCLN